MEPNGDGKVILIGAANPETMRMIAAIKRVTPGFDVIGFIDNDRQKHGTQFHGIPVLGAIDAIPEYAAQGVRFVNLITGSTSARYTVTLDAVRAGAVLTNLIHPSVDLMMTEIGVGNYVQEAVILQAEVSLGNNSSIHMGTLVGHETKIGNSVFIAHAVSISGSCVVGDGTFIGTNATVLPRLKIGRWCVIGAGAVVTKDVPDYSVAVGNPAKVIRTNDVQFSDGDVIS